MRTRKELVYLNVKDLTQEERSILSDLDLDFCDNCGEIDLSGNIIWLDGDEFEEDIYAQSLLASNIFSICKKCFDEKEEIAQCGSCDNYFIVTDKVEECCHCHSGNWVYGCIDDSSPFKTVE